MELSWAEGSSLVDVRWERKGCGFCEPEARKEYESVPKLKPKRTGLSGLEATCRLIWIFRGRILGVALRVCV